MFSGHLTCDEKRYGVTVCMKDWLTDKHNRAALLFAAFFVLRCKLAWIRRFVVLAGSFFG